MDNDNKMFDDDVYACKIEILKTDLVKNPFHIYICIAYQHLYHHLYQYLFHLGVIELAVLTPPFLEYTVFSESELVRIGNMGLCSSIVVKILIMN